MLDDINEFLKKSGYNKLVEEIALELDKVESPAEGGDFKSFLRNQETFHEFKENLTKDFEEMKGVKDAYPEDPKR